MNRGSFLGRRKRCLVLLASRPVVGDHPTGYTKSTVEGEGGGGVGGQGVILTTHLLIVTNLLKTKVIAPFLHMGLWRARTKLETYFTQTGMEEK
jgi:hypothetical protein